MKEYRIIDFHTHPFTATSNNICHHIEHCDMSIENTKRDLRGMGVETICGSVIGRLYGDKPYTFDDVRAVNDEALRLREAYGDFYYPGFHVHPKFVKESIAEIERFHALGFRLIGELVPYLQDWSDYSDSAFFEILEAAEAHKMVVSFHSMGEDEMDEMVKRFKNLTLVAAHPGEKSAFLRHLKRMETSENYYLDTSGTGVFRHGVLRRGIDEFGAERFIYGSDYPVCNPAGFIGAVALDFLLSEEEKEKIFYKNAQRLLKL
ncbi:MAG: amidohydrolase [Clostridia bacterium]|nr:amidohydrolase [Clostridia bacterium]